MNLKFITRAGFGLLFLCLMEWGQAQEYHDIARTRFRLLNTEYEQESHSKVNLTQNRTVFSLPLESDGNFAWYIGGQYLQTVLSTDAVPSLEHNRLTSVRFDIGGIFDLSEISKFHLQITPGIHSDLDDLSIEDFQIGLKTFTEQYRPNGQKLYYGLEYRRSAFGNSLLPIFGIENQTGEKFRYKILIPYEAEFRYILMKKRLYAGASFDYVQDSYRLSDYSEQDYLRTDQVYGFAFVEFMVFKEMAVWGKIGLPLVNSFGIYKKDERYTDVIFLEKPEKKIAEPFHKDFERTVTFEFGLAYRLWFDDQN